jgi:hypothetical protein
LIDWDNKRRFVTKVEKEAGQVTSFDTSEAPDEALLTADYDEVLKIALANDKALYRDYVLSESEALFTLRLNLGLLTVAIALVTIGKGYQARLSLLL